MENKYTPKIICHIEDAVMLNRLYLILENVKNKIGGIMKKRIGIK